MKTTLCLLVRNELECLKIILPQLPAPGPQSGYDAIVAIDGNSTDGSVEYLEKQGIRVVAQSARGRGEAFLQAFRHIESDAYLFFSPDGNEAISDLPRFKKELERGADIVIASRMRSKQMPGAVNEEDVLFFRWRKWANLAFNAFANITFNRTGHWITDSINGYRALTRKAADTLRLDASDYTIEYQMTIRAMSMGIKIVEFPTIEGQRVAGGTGAPSISTGFKFLKRYFKEVNFNRLARKSLPTV